MINILKGCKMEIFVVDAFTESNFKGNPAAVCLLDRELSDIELQNIAMEMNLSETAFVILENESFNLRWFTPKTEVSLCGHATLASAHILWEEQILSDGATARFNTMSGYISAFKHGDWIEMNFPSRVVEKKSAEDVCRALKLNPVFVGKFISPSGNLYLIELNDENEIVELQPEFSELKKTNASAVIITAKSNNTDYDFVSRFFAPALGIDEDPVTGSAHCSLAPYWQDKLGKTDLIGYQASKRSGIVKCRYEDGRVHLSGKAKTFLTGVVRIDK